MTARKSPSPTLGPQRRGTPGPQGMEGHSATSWQTSELSWSQRPTLGSG